MKKMKIRTLIIGFASVLFLVFAVAPVHAQVVQTVTNTYAAKFICGVQPDGAISSMPDAQAGRYSTKINVHNNSGVNVRFRKKVIQLKGGQVPTEPSFRKIEGLRPDWAMEVTCRDIYGHLGIQLPPPGTTAAPPYIEGFVILEVFFPLPSPVAIPRDPLDVAGIYTYRMEPVGTGGNSISVVVYPAKFNSYPLPPPPVDDDPTTTSRLTPRP